MAVLRKVFVWLSWDQNKTLLSQDTIFTWKTTNQQTTIIPKWIFEERKQFGKWQSWRIHTTWFQNLPQIYSHQSSMVLAEGQTYRAMTQNWETMVIWFRQGCHRGRRIFSTNGTGRTGYPDTKDWIWNWVSYHIQKLAWNGSYA